MLSCWSPTHKYCCGFWSTHNSDLHLRQKRCRKWEWLAPLKTISLKDSVYIGTDCETTSGKLIHSLTGLLKWSSFLKVRTKFFPWGKKQPQSDTMIKNPGYSRRSVSKSNKTREGVQKQQSGKTREVWVELISRPDPTFVVFPLHRYYGAVCYCAYQK